MTEQANGTKWIRCEERNPERYGKYRVLCMRGGQKKEDEYLWNGSYWVTPKGSPSHGVMAWAETGEPEGAGTELRAAAGTEIERAGALAMYEARIALYREQIGTGYIGIGKTLNEAKAAGVVPHGEWEDWVRRTTGLEPRQAQRCMQAATEIREGSQMARLEMSKALMLLSSGLDEETRESVAGKAAEEGATVRELREEIARIRKAKADDDAENAETVKALKKQVVQESGAAAEIRIALKKAEGERESLKEQLSATQEAYRQRTEEEKEKAYLQGAAEGAKKARDTERDNASLRDALQHSREQLGQMKRDLEKAQKDKDYYIASTSRALDKVAAAREEGHQEGEKAAGEMIRDLKAQLERVQTEAREKWDDGFRCGNEHLKNALEAVDQQKEAIAAKEKEIEELQEELRAAEAREEKRAAELAALKKEKAQAGMDAARGIGASAVGALDLTAAVRDFIGRAGVLPQMGRIISGMSGKEREAILANVETVGKWVNDSLAILGVVKADARIQ